MGREVRIPRPPDDAQRREEVAARIKAKHRRWPGAIEPKSVLVQPLCNGIDRVLVVYVDGERAWFDRLAPFFDESEQAA